MPAIRFRSRHLHATFVQHMRTQLDARGWITPPINFGTQPVTVLDYQPDERSIPINVNTVAVSLGDLGADQDEELGALGGGLRSALYPVFMDVYMAEQALSLAICDEIRDIFTDVSLPLINQLTSAAVSGTQIDVERISGPEKPPAQIGAENFKRYWRIMRVDVTLYYPS